MEFYVSGTVVITSDPLAAVIENVYIDTTNIILGIYFLTE